MYLPQRLQSIDTFCVQGKLPAYDRMLMTWQPTCGWLLEVAAGLEKAGKPTVQLQAVLEQAFDKVALKEFNSFRLTGGGYDTHGRDSGPQGLVRVSLFQALFDLKKETKVDVETFCDKMLAELPKDTATFKWAKEALKTLVSSLEELQK
jgi:hypothetical protein